jgi:hypothetical protein
MQSRLSFKSALRSAGAHRHGIYEGKQLNSKAKDRI